MMSKYFLFSLTQCSVSVARHGVHLVILPQPVHQTTTTTPCNLIGTKGCITLQFRLCTIINSAPKVAHKLLTARALSEHHVVSIL